MNEKTAYEMSEKYKDTEVNGEKLYVIQAISEKKDKYGQLLCLFSITFIVSIWYYM